jgi:hypothetical protein
MGDADSGDRPFPMLLEVAFRARLEEAVLAGRAGSVSALIRAALEDFDPATVAPDRPPQVAISVRLGAEVRERLRSAARIQGTSIGHLVRAAVEAHLGAVDDAPPAPAPPARPSGVARSRSKRGRKTGPKPAPSRSAPARPVRRTAPAASRPSRPVAASRPKKMPVPARARPARKRRRAK